MQMKQRHLPSSLSRRSLLDDDIRNEKICTKNLFRHAAVTSDNRLFRKIPPPLLEPMPLSGGVKCAKSSTCIYQSCWGCCSACSCCMLRFRPLASLLIYTSERSTSLDLYPSLLAAASITSQYMHMSSNSPVLERVVTKQKQNSLWSQIKDSNCTDDRLCQLTLKDLRTVFAAKFPDLDILDATLLTQALYSAYHPQAGSPMLQHMAKQAALPTAAYASGHANSLGELEPNCNSKVNLQQTTPACMQLARTSRSPALSTLTASKNSNE